MKNKTTNREVVDFINAAANWLNPRTPEGKPDTDEQKKREGSKFAYALNKVNRKCNRLYERYQEDIEDVNVEHCAVDEKGIILRDDRNQYKYEKEAMKKRLKEIRALQDKEVEVEPHFATEVPKELSESEKEVFSGFVIRTEPAVVEKVA